MPFLRSKIFWLGFLPTLFIAALFVAWELDALPFLPALPRRIPTGMDIAATVMIGFLIALNVGLLRWRKSLGSCPRGIRRSTGLASVIGVVTLLCPICLALPLSIAGLGIVLSILSAFLPLLRIIALLLLVTATALLWPRRKL